MPLIPTLEMQKAYFDEIDRNMHRVEHDMRFGRFDNHRLAYQKMIAAAPANPLPLMDRETILALFKEHIRLVPVDPDAYERHADYIDNTDDQLQWRVKPESEEAFADAIIQIGRGK